MTETSSIKKDLPKEKQYKLLQEQIVSLTKGEDDLIANLSNICAVLKYEMNWFWVGFYLVKNEELVLSTFQGPVACTRIKKGKGVCGIAWANKETIIVPNVNEFEGHIACSSLTQSEIVVPLVNKKGICFGVFDIDSEHLNNFDDVDRLGLEEIVKYITSLF